MKLENKVDQVTPDKLEEAPNSETTEIIKTISDGSTVKARLPLSFVISTLKEILVFESFLVYVHVVYL